MTSTPFDPGPASGVEAGGAEAVEADGRWTLVLRRRLRHPRPRHLVGADRSRAAGGMGPVHLGPRPGPHG